VIHRPADNLTFERLAAYLLFLAILGAACHMPAQSDTFWQLRAGADIARTGRVPLVDTFSHTVRGQPWPNHEWGSELAFYALHRLGGFPLLTAALAGLVVLAWAIAWRLMRGPVPVRVALVAMLGISSARLWSLRPQVVSLCLLVLSIELLARRRERWLPAVFAVWANLHGGVVLGFAAVLGGLVGATLVDRARARRAVLVAVACMAAACLTPLGTSLWTEVPSMLERLRQYEVAEWRPTSLADPWNLPFWIACVAVPPLAWRVRRRLDAGDATVIGASLALLLLGVRTTRNVMPALLLAAPALARLLAARDVSPIAAGRREHLRANAAIAIVATLAVTFWVGSSWTRGAERLNWEPMPSGAIEAIARCRPALYNLYDNGGYVAWFVPSQPVFIDSRQDPFPPSLVASQIRAETTGEYEPIFSRHGIGCAALPAGSRVAARLVADGWQRRFSSPGWMVLQRP
jgi:hypothetical protein